jgi:signal transduction histidine kinase
MADRAALAIENARLVESLRFEVDERKQNEENLRLTMELLKRTDEKRQALMEHLVTAQEEERRRIAIDVHDDSIQAMAAIGLRLQVMRRRAQSPELADQIAEVEDTVTNAIGRLRGLLFRLESQSVEAVGLARALTLYVAEVFPEAEPRTRVTSTMAAELNGPTQLVLYRIAQEAVNNIRKHANPLNVVVTLTDDDGGAVLAVQDDGAGFDPDETTKHALPGHLGMRSMQERAEIAGGRLSIESSPGQGTTVRCWVPVLAKLPVDAPDVIL